MPPDELGVVLVDARELRERVLAGSAVEELAQLAIEANAGWTAVCDFADEHPEHRDDLRPAAFAFGFVAALAMRKIEVVQRMAYGPVDPIARALSTSRRSSPVAQQPERRVAARPRQQRARRVARTAASRGDPSSLSSADDPLLALAVSRRRR